MPENSGESDTPADRSDENLTPKEAYQLTEEQGLKGKTVAKMFDVSEAWVSQRKSQYQEALQDGKESVDPSDFETDELREALGDSEPEHNPYDHTCPNCNDLIPAPNTAGEHDCPECGETLVWEESEI